MKKQPFCFTLFLLIGFSMPLIATAQPVNIPDANLHAAIEDALGKASGAPITTADMANLTTLEARNANISDLNGLEHATNLIRLRLRRNSISDLSVLAGLPKLTGLELHNNSISDISALAGLTKLTNLELHNNSISDISALAGLTKLTGLRLSNNNSLSDISALAGLTKLTWLSLGDTSISDISVLVSLTKLTTLWLGNNSISDISALAGLTRLTGLLLWGNNISDISPLAGLTQLESLILGDNSISDISVLVSLTKLRFLQVGNNISDISVLSGLTKLTDLDLGDNNISDISLLVGLTQLEGLWLNDNNISDISVLSGLPKLTWLSLRNNNISDISVLSGLTNLDWLFLDGNSLSNISVLSGLTNLRLLYLDDNNISDISPLAENTGLGNGDEVLLRANPLNYQSIKTHIPALQSRGITVAFDNLIRKYVLSVRAGISLIHVPLNVTAVNDTPKTITTIADLYDALGGASKVNFLIIYDPHTQAWRSYFSSSDRGSAADMALADDTAIVAGIKTPVILQLTGDALGTSGSGAIALYQGLNLVGLPLNNPDLTRVSDLLGLDGIRGNVPVIIGTDGGEFQAVGRAGDPGDILLTGGQGFILTAQQAATVAISGEAWTNTSGGAAPTPVVLKGIDTGDTTPILALRGVVVDEVSGLKLKDIHVTAKNLSTDSTAVVVTAPDTGEYRLTFVDIETSRAATVGDTFEIAPQPSNPFISVEPLRYTVTAEDVKQSLIQLPELVAYEIPAETQLLANYPNPFNPETWIPYRLAEDAFVTLTIYDGAGQVVRTLDVGHQIAAVYEGRSKAIYWDGRNGLGEQVASGIYFYHLSAGDFSATRKMVILK